MAGPHLNSITLPAGGSGFSLRPPVDEEGADDCPACEALRRDQTRAALVEFRRALKMLDANAQALIAALDLEC